MTDDGQNLSWLIPVTAKIYTTVEKEPLTTSHTVTLSKYGQDDNQLKSGATYTLYKMEGEVVNVNKDTKVGQYTTGKNGQIIVPDLEAGKYYFIEKNDGAPVGYNSNSEPVEFELGNGELVLENKTGDTVQEKPIDGAYVLGGDASDDITIKVNPPKDGSLERLKVVWTEGNQGGNPGTREYVIGEGTSKGDVIYVKNQEAAIAAAEAQLKDCHEKYQNVKISASFTQKVSVEQTDPLKPVDISIKASKTLLNTKDAPITPIPQFEFTLENDPDFPDTPEQNLTATNDAQGKIAFQAFQVGSEISSKKDVYQYHYILKETKDKVTKDEGSPEYAYEYDTEVWKVTVNVIKDAEGLKVQSVTYDKQDGGSNESNTTGAEFTNRRQSAPLEFVKVDERVKEVSGAGFTLYECKNTQDGHDHSEGCNWDNKTPYRKEIKSGDNGKIRFEELPVGQSYILVETTIPKGFKVPAEGSYIVASIALDGTLTLSGRGDFAKEGMISVDGGNYAVQNIHQYNLSIKKTIEGDGGNLDYKFNFKITFKDAKDNLINGTYQYTGSSFDKAEKPEDGTITFENGIATIQLKHGQVITIQDIDAKSKYEVVEKETGIDGYQTTVNGANSTDLDSDKTASFTNMKISAPKTGLWGITGTGTETIFLLLAGLAITGFCIRRKRRI